MKKFIVFLLLLIGFVALSPPDPVQAAPQYESAFVVDVSVQDIAPFAQDESGAGIVEEIPQITSDDGYNFFKENWGALLLGLLGFFEVIVRLTPTQKDNSLLNLLMTIINAILPNIKKGGGRISADT